MKALFKLLVVLALFAGAAGGGAYFWLMQWAHEGVDVGEEKIFDLKPGTTLGGLAKELEGAGLVSRSSFYHFYVRFEGNYKRFQAGKYRFTGSVAPADVSQAFVKGDVWNPVVLSVTIPEGFTLKNITERLAANGVGHIVELKNLCSDKSFLQSLKVPAATLEGYVYPATYTFHTMPTAMQALEQMVKTFWEKLPKDYEKQVEAKGLTLAQAVVFASLIQMETRLDEEKSLISEVIWRRLKDKAPLAIDAALIYGIPDYAGDLKWSHLQDAKNPYNTRIHVGLPPTAIGAPGVQALEAVLTPSNFGYYYYVLMPDLTRHHFSKTLAEHNLHVKKLLNSTKSNKKTPTAKP